MARPEGVCELRGIKGMESLAGPKDATENRASRGGLASGSVYFIRAGDAGPIKVGYAMNVRRRLSELQMGCPCPLHLLHTEPGTLATERGWHERLADYHHRGEWYRPNWIISQHLKKHGVKMKPYTPLPYVRSERQFGEQEGPLKKALRQQRERQARLTQGT